MQMENCGLYRKRPCESGMYLHRSLRRLNAEYCEVDQLLLRWREALGKTLTRTLNVVALLRRMQPFLQSHQEPLHRNLPYIQDGPCFAIPAAGKESEDQQKSSFCWRLRRQSRSVRITAKHVRRSEPRCRPLN